MTEKNRLRGKKSRAAGQRFELKVRKSLEEKGWNVSKWMNNVEFTKEIPEVRMLPDTGERDKCREFMLNGKIGKLIPAKGKFNPFTKSVMNMSAGFPDFIAFFKDMTGRIRLMGVEAKSNGYLTPVEKEKCDWLCKNVFKVVIAKKGDKRGEIIYEDFT